MRILAGLLALSLSGCYSLKLSLENPDPERVQMTEVKKGRKIGHFVRNDNVIYVLGGLLTIGPPSLTEMLALQLQAGKRVSNLKIRSWEWLHLGFVTFGTVQVEGDEIQAATP